MWSQAGLVQCGHLSWAGGWNSCCCQWRWAASSTGTGHLPKVESRNCQMKRAPEKLVPLPWAEWVYLTGSVALWNASQEQSWWRCPLQFGFHSPVEGAGPVGLGSFPPGSAAWSPVAEAVLPPGEFRCWHGAPCWGEAGSFPSMLWLREGNGVPWERANCAWLPHFTGNSHKPFMTLKKASWISWCWFSHLLETNSHALCFTSTFPF